MPESLETVLVCATQSALETTAFLFADAGLPADADAVEAPAPIVATVTFEGARAGALSVAFPARLLPVLAANVLGEEDVPSDAMQYDALGELANIICGNVLPALDPCGKYSLGPPSVVHGPVTLDQTGAVRVASGDLQLDGERIGTALWLRAPASADRTA